MLFKRRKKTDDTQLHIESIPDESTKGFNVVEICEQNSRITEQSMHLSQII